MMKTLACATSCYGSHIDLFASLRDIASLGFTGVEFMSIPHWFDHLSPELQDHPDHLETCQTAREHHLAIPAMSAHCELGQPGGAELLLARLNLAHELGIKKVLTGAGNLKDSQEVRQFETSIARALKLAEQTGILLLIETGGPSLPTGAKVKTVVDHFGSDSLRIAYDPANVSLWGQTDPLRDVSEVMDLVKHVHIKEYRAGWTWHPPLGEGQVNFNQFFTLLNEAHYPGDFSIEVDFREGEGFDKAHDNLERSLKFLHEKTNFDETFQFQEFIGR